MTKLLGIDPGKTTGWGLIRVDENRKIHVLQFGQTRDTTLLEIRDYLSDADLIVYESWLTRPGDARKGSFDYDPMITPQVIGALKLQCQLLGKQVAEQSPSVKPPAYGFLGRKYQKGKKGQHQWDALAHAVYYAVKHLKAKPVGLG